MTRWDHILIEAFCLFNSMSKKEWKMYKYKDPKDIFNKSKVEITIQKNEGYINPKEKPDWCKKKDKVPCYKCLSNNCPFLSYTNATIKDRMLFAKAYHEKYKKQ